MTTPLFRHHVRYHEVDQQGFLFNARYLEIADVGLTEFIRELGWSYEDINALGVDPSVASVELDFREPARFDDELEVMVACTAVGRSSFRLTTDVTRNGNTVAQVRAVYVNVEAKAARSVGLPAEFVAALTACIPSEGGTHEPQLTTVPAVERSDSV